MNESNFKINNSEKKRNMSFDRSNKNSFSDSLKIFSDENANLKSQNIFEGYLVKNIWIKEWKKYTNYNKIINEFISPTNEKRQDILIKLYTIQKNNNIKDQLTPIKALYFNEKNEYENYLKYYNLVEVNTRFYNCFIEKNPNFHNINPVNKIKYSFHNNIITIYFNETKIDLISLKNIILKQTYANLLILKEINRFQEESKYSIKNFNKIGMVEKNWIQEFKNKYLYNQYSSIIKINDIMKIIRTKEFSDIIKKIERKNELDIKSKEKLKNWKIQKN